MEIVRIVLGPYDEYTYIVKEGDYCAVIDPEINRGEIARELERRGWVPDDILLTHAHHDHLRGVNGLPQSAVLRIHEADAPYVAGTNEDVGDPFAKEEPISRPVCPFRDGDVIGPFTVLHTPGHSPGSSLFVAPGHVFSGDSMFAFGVPILHFPLSDAAAYRASLEKMRRLDQDALLHPGHGTEGARVRDGIPT